MTKLKLTALLDTGGLAEAVSQRMQFAAHLPVVEENGQGTVTEAIGSTPEEPPQFILAPRLLDFNIINDTRRDFRGNQVAGQLQCVAHRIDCADDPRPYRARVS